MRPSVTAISKRSSPTNPDAMANTSQGMNIVAKTLKITRSAPSAANASLAKELASSPASNFFENIGTKAMLNAPSAKKRRNMLGSENAIKNASATGPVPSQAAIKMSRMKPNTRLSRVQNPTVSTPDTSLICFTCPRPCFGTLLRIARALCTRRNGVL